MHKETTVPIAITGANDAMLSESRHALPTNAPAKMYQNGRYGRSLRSAMLPNTSLKQMNEAIKTRIATLVTDHQSNAIRIGSNGTTVKIRCKTGLGIGANAPVPAVSFAIIVYRLL